MSKHNWITLLLSPTPPQPVFPSCKNVAQSPFRRTRFSCWTRCLPGSSESKAFVFKASISEVSFLSSHPPKTNNFSFHLTRIINYLVLSLAYFTENNAFKVYWKGYLSVLMLNNMCLNCAPHFRGEVQGLTLKPQLHSWIPCCPQTLNPKGWDCTQALLPGLVNCMLSLTVNIWVPSTSRRLGTAAAGSMQLWLQAVPLNLVFRRQGGWWSSVSLRPAQTT